MLRSEVGASTDPDPGLIRMPRLSQALLLRGTFLHTALCCRHWERGWKVNHLETGEGRPFMAAWGHHEEPGSVSATVTSLCL